ncbi:hypothetical protein CASFOL_033980 [Castilleja foliolosa]|uniref:Histone chaperone domain-containing protein n=1 Tax=Castilleja foliolosa TaxID=1961234 RepID=A0ABD3BZS6_9LAMI
MADVKPVGEGAELPEKRKLDIPSPVSKSLEVNNDESNSNKRPKTEVPSRKNGSISPAEEPEEEDEENGSDEDGDEDIPEEPKIVDRKGKGIMIDDKGKGKMLEDSEDDDSDDDDSSSDDSDSDFSDGLDESDWEDDPLAEVDLDNILPSRTRRPQAQSGVRIGGFPDKGNNV